MGAWSVLAEWAGPRAGVASEGIVYPTNRFRVSTWLLAAVALVAVQISLSKVAQAQSDAWVLMGSRDVDLSGSQDRIDLSTATGRFKAIRLVAKSRSITLTRVEVGYEDGRSHVEDRTINLLAGERTAPIGAANGEHFVDRISLAYRSVQAGAGVATVEIWGLQSPEGARAVRTGSPEASAGSSGSGGQDQTAAKREVRRDEDQKAQAEAKQRADQEAARKEDSTRRAQAAQAQERARPVAPKPPPTISAPAPGSSSGGGGSSGGSGSSRSVGAASPSTTAPSAPQPGPSRGPIAAAPPPADAKPYASVPVLFGTDRKQGPDRKAKWGDTVATFGFDSQYKLALGKAVVTVPIEGRERGSVSRPELIVFGFRVPWGEEQLDKHFTVYSARKLDEGAFLDEVKQSLAKSKSFEKHAFLFIHGYNVNFEDALYRTAQIAHDLEFDGAAFMYSWPSKGDPRAYLLDEDRAKGARPYLREMLDLIASKTDVEHLHIVAHSKGAELAVEVLSSLSTMSDVRKKMRINEIILAAPDIDRANFEQIAEKIVGVALRGVTLYASNNDKALELSAKFRLGNVRAGEVPADRGPVLIKGMDTIDISAASTDFFSSNHITFAERLSLITDMSSIMRTGQHPPDMRSSKLFSVVPTDRGKYWQFMK